MSKTSVENSLVEAIIRDNKPKLIQDTNEIITLSSISSDEPEPFDRGMILKLLHLCCEFECVNCAEALIKGEINGVIPLINEVGGGSGFAALHIAADNQAHRCIELLIRKRGRIDLKTKAPAKAGNARLLLPLEVALRSSSVGSSGDGEICKCFGSATGCARGSTCFYRHIYDDLCAPKSRVGNARSTVLAKFWLQIFVGGLPPAMDSNKRLFNEEVLAKLRVRYCGQIIMHRENLNLTTIMDNARHRRIFSSSTD